MVLGPRVFLRGAFGKGRRILGEKTDGMAEVDGRILLKFWLTVLSNIEGESGGFLLLDPKFSVTKFSPRIQSKSATFIKEFAAGASS